MSEVKVGMCCKERTWSSCEKHTRDYSRVLNEYVIKEKECSSKTDGAEHCVCSMEEERRVWSRKKISQGSDDGIGYIPQKLCGTVMEGGRLSFTKKLFNGVSLFSQQAS